MTQYFRSQLSSQEKTIYDQLFTAFTEQRRSIPVGNLRRCELLTDLIEKLCQDNPQLFYVKSWKYLLHSREIQVVPVYRLSPAEIRAYESKCRAAAEDLAAQCQRRTVYDSVLAVHDLLAAQVRYRKDSFYCYSLVGPLVLGYGVCEGYAKAFKYVLDQMEVSCIVVHGDGLDPADQSREAHAWNLVQLNGQWLHVDVTYDSTLSAVSQGGTLIRRDYFGLPSLAMLIDHDFVQTNYPPALCAQYAYYRHCGLSFPSRRRAEAYLAERLTGAADGFALHLPFYRGREDGQWLLDTVFALLEQRGSGCRLGLRSNPRQKVFQLLVVPGDESQG